MRITKVALREAPEVARVVRSAFGSYRKRDAYVGPFGGDLIINSYWDGGSRAEFAAVNLATGQRTDLARGGSHPYFDVARRGVTETSTQDGAITVDRAGNVHLHTLPANWVIVEAGTFCGKPATAHVYVNAENLARLLPGVSAS